MADSQKWNSVILLCFLWGWPSNQDNPNWFINVTLKYWIDIPNSQTIFWNISAQDILISLPIPHLLTFSSHSNLDNFIMSLLKYSLGLCFRWPKSKYLPATTLIFPNSPHYSNYHLCIWDSRRHIDVNYLWFISLLVWLQKVTS